MLQDELRRLGRYPLLVIGEIGYTPVRTRGRPIVPQLPIAAAAKTGGIICRRGEGSCQPAADLCPLGSGPGGSPTCSIGSVAASSPLMQANGCHRCRTVMRG
jgi:hypothetical protein